MCEIHMMPYRINNLEKVLGWNVMISPEGEVYKIFERDKLSVGHDFFAEMYVSKMLNKDINLIWKEYKCRHVEVSSINLAPKDILINFFGFVNYEKDVKLEIKGPQYFYAGKKVTDKQILIIQKLMTLNRDNDLRAFSTFLRETNEKEDVRRFSI